MNRIYSIILFIFLLCLYRVIFAQDFSGEIPYRHYTVADGLAGSNVMSFLQDKHGFIWFATSNGLSRFDGTEFKNFTTANGLGSNNLTGLGLMEDTIFISSYDNGLFYLNNGHIYNYQIENRKLSYIHNMIVYGNHLFTYWTKLYDISGGSITDAFSKLKYKTEQERIGFHINSMANMSDGSLLICTTSGLFKYKNKHLYNYNIKGITNNKIFTCVYRTKNNKTLLYGYGSFWELRDDNISKLFPQIRFPKNKYVQHIFVDDFNNLWFSLINSGLYLIKDSILYNVGENIGLEKFQVNFIKKDREGNVWVGTFGKGVYCFFNLSVTNFNSKQGLRNSYIMTINSINENNILVGTFNGLFCYNNKQFYTIETGFAGGFNYIRDIEKINDNEIYVTGSFDKSKNQFLELSTIKKDNTVYKIFIASACCFINKNIMLIGGWDSDLRFVRVKNNYFTLYPVIKLFTNDKEGYRINKIIRVKNGNIWIGTTGGLCMIKDSKQKYFKDNSLLANNINDIKEGPNNTIWIAGDGGISLLKDDSWTNYSKIKGLDLTSSKSITFDNSGNAWIGNAKGIFKIVNGNITNYTGEFGLTSKEINSVYFNRGTNELWVGTNDGLSKINLNIYNHYEKAIPSIAMEYVVTNDSIYNDFSHLDFNSNINRITIRFAGIYFRDPKSLTYQYKIQNKENNWTVSQNPEIQFASLSPGQYNMLIRAKSLDGKWSNPIGISFFISEPFTGTYWFYLILIMCFIIPAVLVTKRVAVVKHKKLQAKKDIDNKIIELKQQALSAMMSPHFIFNSLNSIQNFINNHDKNDANDYLTKFARLIRLNLDMAQKSFISMDEEIDRLTLYLSLEKIRFGDNFNYSIVVDDNIDKKYTQLPNMIIQPFVENAIWHGILPNNKMGSIIIKFNADEKMENLIISIVDDGVGFPNSNEVEKTNHIPHGINIIQERLELLNQASENRNILNIKTTDSINNFGTTVEIILPMMYS